MRIILSTIMLLVLTSLISACNTMAGAGEDMQVGGKKLERSADQNK